MTEISNNKEFSLLNWQNPSMNEMSICNEEDLSLSDLLMNENISLWNSEGLHLQDSQVDFTFPHSPVSVSNTECSENESAISSPSSFNSSPSSFFGGNYNTTDLTTTKVELNTPNSQISSSPNFNLVVPSQSTSAFASSSFQLLPPLPSQVEIKMESSKQSKSSKKRRRDGDSCVKLSSEDGAEDFQELSYDELLTFTGAQIDQYIKTIRLQRQLAPEKERELKKMRRLIKNREYAQSSRSRKREVVDILKKQVDELTAENEEYQKKINQLDTENKELKLQMARIGLAMKKDPEIEIRISKALDNEPETTSKSSSSPSSSFVNPFSISKPGSTFFTNSFFVFFFFFAIVLPLSYTNPELTQKAFNTGRAILGYEVTEKGLVDYITQLSLFKLTQTWFPFYSTNLESIQDLNEQNMWTLEEEQEELDKCNSNQECLNNLQLNEKIYEEKKLEQKNNSPTLLKVDL